MSPSDPSPPVAAWLTSSQDLPLARLAAPPVFIIGKARSGTTWVYDILTAHPAVAGVFESWLLTEASGVGALLRERNWSKEGSGIAQLMTRDDFVDDLRLTVGRWLARALAPEQRFLVEKSPGLHLATVATIFPDARIIHCVRDGRDVAVSILAASNSWAPEWKRRMGRSTFAAARSWRSVIETVHRESSALGPRLLDVRYEALKGAPSIQIRRLYDFCEIPYDDHLVEDVMRATNFDTAFQGGEREFRRGGRVGDWHDRFGFFARAQFAAGAGATLRSLGYERSRWWWWRRQRSRRHAR